jgi:hydrogenase expression/formation protein HypC
MCLAVPGEVIELGQRHGLRFAKVRFGGMTCDVCIEYVPEVVPGDFVLVHVGFALARVDAEEAERSLRTLQELGQLAELAGEEMNGGLSGPEGTTP